MLYVTPSGEDVWRYVDHAWGQYGRILAIAFMDREVEDNIKAKKNEANNQSSWPNELGH